MTVAKRRKTLRGSSCPSGRTAAAPPDVPEIRYIESSALVAALLEGDDSAIASIRAPGRRVTSILTVLETSRAVLRAHVMGRITGQQQRAALHTLQRFARRCHLVSVTDAILSQAGRLFPVEPVRTLDAIHLATAAALGEPAALVIMVSRDRRVCDNAAALGHPVE